MDDSTSMILFLIAWFALQWWILPKLGVPT
jgi:hypothetical protein